MRMNTSLKNFFLVLLAIPTLRFVELVIPLQISFSYRVFTLFLIFFLMLMFYVYYLNIKELGHTSNGFSSLYYVVPLAVVLSLLVFFINKPEFFFRFSLISLFVAAFISYVHAFYFQGMLQNLGERILGKQTVIVFISILLAVLFINKLSIFLIISILLLSYAFGIIYSRSKNLFVIAIGWFCFYFIGLMVLPALF